MWFLLQLKFFNIKKIALEQKLMLFYNPLLFLYHNFLKLWLRIGNPEIIDMIHVSIFVWIVGL